MKQIYKDAWNDIEDDDTVYFMTWNPKPKFYGYDNGGENDYKMQWFTMLDKLVQSARCLSKYAFVAEISDQGKLHMHGWYVIKDAVKYHKSWLPTLRTNGFIKNPKVKSVKWKSFKYHVKDLESTIEYITDIDCVITHHNCKTILKELTLYKMEGIVKYAKIEKAIKKPVYSYFGNTDYEEESNKI